MKARKYHYEQVLQLDYGQGWEDEIAYESNSIFALSKEKTLERGRI